MVRCLKPSVRLCVAASLLVAGSLATPSKATAGNPYTPRFTWKTVINYETVREPVTVWVTKFDHCGQPYRIAVTTYRTIQVPVEQRVKVYF